MLVLAQGVASCAVGGSSTLYTYGILDFLPTVYSMDTTHLLQHLRKNLNCPQCQSEQIRYEANDSTAIISFTCQTCKTSIRASYNLARQHGFEPLGVGTIVVTRLDDNGDVVSSWSGQI